MFYFTGTRKPNFKNLKDNIYSDYWQKTGYEMRHDLREREVIFLDWVKDGAKVLSLGCGNSRLLYELKARKKCTVFGLDIEQLVVRALKEQGIEAQAADLSSVNFSLSDYFAGKFDYIIISEILEHLALPEKLITKIRDQAEFLVISIPNSAFYRYRFGLMFNGRFFTQWLKHPAEHLRFWSHIDFLDWLKAMELNVVVYKSSNGPEYLRDFWPNLFGHQICYLVKN